MKITDTHIYFWMGENFLSNFYPANFKLVDYDFGILNPEISFANSEQAFMYYKAKFFNDEESVTKILLETDPGKAKKLGRKVEGFNDEEWDKVKKNFMYIVNLLKFKQNPELKKQLLKTGDKKLVEASPYDKIWGVGLGENDPDILDESKWKGQNLLGNVLHNVRFSFVLDGFDLDDIRL